MAAMASAFSAPECLRRGRLRQFSATYGGWVSIRLVLLSHALVVDPDADVPSAVSVTPRKRRNSLKMWMDLCLVENIAEVRKADAPADKSAAAARRVSHGSQRGAAPRHVFVVTTELPKAQEFRFDAESEEDREEWVRCLLLAKKLQSVNAAKRSAEATSTSASAQASDEVNSQLAFLRFASSGSEDSDSDLENMPPSFEPTSPQQHSIRSAQNAFSTSAGSTSTTLKSPVSVPVTLTILAITITAEDGTSISASIPLGLSSLDTISVHRIKFDAIQQMRKYHLGLLGNNTHPSSDLQTSKQQNTTAVTFQDLVCRSPDWFMLVHKEQKLWLQDEQRAIGAYLPGLAKVKKMVLALRPAYEMPHPTLRLTITDAKTKVSDLTQREYTAYIIDVVFSDMTWQLARRYKEFAALHSQLAKKYSGHDTSLPVLPPKHVFTPKEGEFVDRRRLQLEHYLLRLMMHPIVSNDVLLLSFLGVVSTSRDPELSQSHMGVLHVTSLHNSLSYGDILLFSCKFGASVLQRTFTGSKYDHVGIVVPGASRSLLRIMEATSDGIQVYSLKLRLMAYSREVSNSIIVRRFIAERTPSLVNELSRFVERVEGNPYSILGILHSSGESDRAIQDLMASSASDSSGDDNRREGGIGDFKTAESSYGGYTSSTGSTHSASMNSPTMSGRGRSKASKKEKQRKYFCSSLVASALKQIGWLNTTRKSSSFWPGSFEDGGEIEKLLATGVSLGPETRVDCRIVEVGLATSEN